MRPAAPPDTRRAAGERQPTNAAPAPRDATEAAPDTAGVGSATADRSAPRPLPADAPAHTYGRDPWRALLAAASAPYRSLPGAGGRFAWHFARGKLGFDPVFRAIVADGLIAPASRVLDIGCGQGLLASLLHAAAQHDRQGGWPADWAPAPAGCRVTGIELMAKDVQRARAALVEPAVVGAADFVCGDMRDTPFPTADAVVILDVLHYIDIAAQDAVLTRVRQALRPGGRLLLRVGDAAARRGFRVSQWVDAVVTFVRGHRAVPLHGRPLSAWTARLEALGFSVQARPMSQGTPFANVLLVARLADDPHAGAAAGRRHLDAGAAGGGGAYTAAHDIAPLANLRAVRQAAGHAGESPAADGRLPA